MKDGHKEHDDPPSRTEQKRNAQDLQELGMKLLELPQAEMVHFTLPEAVTEALANARNIDRKNHGALRRQRQRIGTLMGDLDPTQLREEFRCYRAHLHVPRASATWAERLLDDDAAMTEFCEAYPQLDVQVIRQWVRAFRRSPNDEKKAANKERLIKALRQLGL